MIYYIIYDIKWYNMVYDIIYHITYLQNWFLLSNLKSEFCNTQMICTKIFKKFILQDKKWDQLQNQQKYILQQENVVAGKNLPYDIWYYIWYDIQNDIRYDIRYYILYMIWYMIRQAGAELGQALLSLS